MNLKVASRLVLGALTALLWFGVLSAIAGAFLAIAANGAGVPMAYLANSPFSSYLVPGLILGAIVGGTQLAAAIALSTKRRAGLLLAAVAGFGMMIWIFVELAIIGKYSWLQSVYFSLGVVELIGVFALLGIGPSLVVPWRGSPAHTLAGVCAHRLEEAPKLA